jgi:para-aminobenzoate synthetase component 1
LDNHNYKFQQHTYECIVAAGSQRSVEARAGNAFDKFQALVDDEKDWIFGHLSYDLKNEIEELQSNGSDEIQFPDLFFFVPEIIVQLDGSVLTIGSCNPDHDLVYQQIISTEINQSKEQLLHVDVQSKITRERYIDTIKYLQQHIQRGDCYEINFCQEFYVKNIIIDPVKKYLSLSDTSPNPYSAFYKLNDKYLLCASPERYLKKTGKSILTQPIKGTWQRNTASRDEDEENRILLSRSIKDRSENVMVVDLVRNDLSKVCIEGSVKVDELFGIYEFPQVFQMISTISGELTDNVTIADIFRATFPMGSMTGAPKKRVMELIEQYEDTKRGIFSGALGYITPGGDFDFNVVIRSILYNSSNQYLSFMAGSGITIYSEPEKEFEECLLKAGAIKKVLTEDPRF